MHNFWSVQDQLTSQPNGELYEEHGITRGTLDVPAYSMALAAQPRAPIGGGSRRINHLTDLREDEMAKECAHLDQIQEVMQRAGECEECLKTGDRWVELRVCQSCGHVGCCDSSKNKHATKHFQTVGHPIIRSFGSGKNWRWCYIDHIYV